LVGSVLPCKYCRESYKGFLSIGNTKLTDEVMENRESLTKWFYYIHEAVNKKLDIDYGVSYNDVVKKFESYRATCGKTNKYKGCITPLNKKANSYKNAELKESPIIPVNLANQFIDYANIRGCEQSDFETINKCKADTDLATLLSNKDSKEWCDTSFILVCLSTCGSVRFKLFYHIII